jgi:hypothetical protein
MSTIKATTLSTQSNATVPIDTVVNGTAKAWVNFNGTGTVAIRASFNVSSITDNGVGVYTVNLTTAMSNIDYVVNAAIGWAGGSVSSNSVVMLKDNVTAPTASSFQVATAFASNGAAYDVTRILVTVFS